MGGCASASRHSSGITCPDPLTGPHGRSYRTCSIPSQQAARAFNAHLTALDHFYEQLGAVRVRRGDLSHLSPGRWASRNRSGNCAVERRPRLGIEPPSRLQASAPQDGRHATPADAQARRGRPRTGPSGVGPPPGVVPNDGRHPAAGPGDRLATDEEGRWWCLPHGVSPGPCTRAGTFRTTWSWSMPTGKRQAGQDGARPSSDSRNLVRTSRLSPRSSQESTKPVRKTPQALLAGSGSARTMRTWREPVRT